MVGSPDLGNGTLQNACLVQFSPDANPEYP